ncbi:MAB_1171c family putative transporter [Sphaerisporangium sp. B11E5]|uniref:MAB_1171c family putative transporter n=1 Tax=Sphaerisporangium sp. B11E5 TaxID=3153563 RepID=UPI00325D7606
MAEALRHYGPAAIAWVLLAYRVSKGRRGPPDPAQDTVWLVLLGLSLSLTLLTPAVYAFVGRVTGIPNLARLLGHGGMLIVAWSAKTFLWHLNHPVPAGRPRTGFHLTVVILTFAVMCALFMAADTPVNDVRFAARYAAAPWVLEYWLVYSAYLIPAFAIMAALGWRYARMSTAPLLRVGLRLVTLGAYLAIGYQVHKTLTFAAERLSFSYPPAGNLLADGILPLLAHLLVLSGATLPAWGRLVNASASLVWLDRYRTYQTLRPLWRALYAANPHIALTPATPALLDLLTVRDLNLRLYRRVIEIRDGRLALTPYLEPDIATTAHTDAARTGPYGQALDAAAEAAALHTALRAKARGLNALPDTVAHTPGGKDLNSDTAFLCEVARAFRTMTSATGPHRAG